MDRRRRHQRRLAGNAEQDRRDVADRVRDRQHAEKKANASTGVILSTNGRWRARANQLAAHSTRTANRRSLRDGPSGSQWSKGPATRRPAPRAPDAKRVLLADDRASDRGAGSDGRRRNRLLPQEQLELQILVLLLLQASLLALDLPPGVRLLSRHVLSLMIDGSRQARLGSRRTGQGHREDDGYY